MKLFLPFLSILFTLYPLSKNAYAQNLDTLPFSPPGAIWQYETFEWGARVHHMIEFKSDTIINGRLCKKMDYYINRYLFHGPNHDTIVKTVENLGNLYYASADDTLYYVDRNTWNLQVLHNFSLNIGESILVQENEFYTCIYSSITSNPAILDSSYNLSIGNMQIPVQRFKAQGPWSFGYYWSEENRIAKNFGSLFSPTPFFTFDSCSTSPDFATGYLFRGLECYYDDLRGYIPFKGNVSECQKNLHTFSNEQFSGVLNLKAYPNPSSDFVEILGLLEGEYDSLKMELFDLQGRKMTIERDLNRLNISSLKTGTYILKVQKGKAFQTLKIIKI